MDKVQKAMIKLETSKKQWWSKNGEKAIQSVILAFQTFANIVMFSVGIVVAVIKKMVSSLMYLWENNKAFRDVFMVFGQDKTGDNQQYHL